MTQARVILTALHLSGAWGLTVEESADPPQPRQYAPDYGYGYDQESRLSWALSTKLVPPRRTTRPPRTTRTCTTPPTCPATRRPGTPATARTSSTRTTTPSSRTPGPGTTPPCPPITGLSSTPAPPCPPTARGRSTPPPPPPCPCWGRGCSTRGPGTSAMKLAASRPQTMKYSTCQEYS